MRELSYQAYADEISGNAREVTRQIHSTIATNNMDVANTVVLIGEAHDQMGHQLWEKSFLQANKEIGHKFVFTDETIKTNLDVILPPRKPADFYGAIQTVNKQFKGDHFSHLTPIAYAVTEAIHYRAVDLAKEIPGDAYSNTAGLPESYRQGYRQIPVFKELLDKIPDICVSGRYAASSSVGIMQRNLTMAARISAESRQHKALVVHRSGGAHLGRDHKEMPSLTEMLLHLGKDVITVGLGDSDWDTAAENNRLLSLEKTPPNVKFRHREHYAIALPDLEFDTNDERDNQREGWDMLAAFQQEAKSGTLMSKPSEKPSGWHKLRGIFQLAP